MMAPPRMRPTPVELSKPSPIPQVNHNGLSVKQKRKKNTTSTGFMCWNPDEHHVMVPSHGRGQRQHGDTERALTGVRIPSVPWASIWSQKHAQQPWAKGGVVLKSTAGPITTKG